MLDWNRDKKYFKISLYVFLTVLAIYVATHIGLVFSAISQVINWIWKAFSIVFIAFIFAYIFDPIVDWIEIKMMSLKAKKNASQQTSEQDDLIVLEAKFDERENLTKRTLSTILTYVMVILVLLLLIGGVSLYIGMSIGDHSAMKDLQSTADQVTYLIDNTTEEISGFYENAKKTMQKWGVYPYVEDYMNDVVAFIAKFIEHISINISAIVGILAAMGSMVVNFFISIVIAFYFLRDKRTIKYYAHELLYTFIPKRAADVIKLFLSDANMVFSGFIQGQLLDAAIVALLMTIGFSIIGLNFAVLIGIFSGFANIIPYLGPITGFVISVLVALLSGEPMQALWAAIIVIAIQQLDSLIISPRVVGSKVELKPVLVIIALAAGGTLYGLPGMILAVPVFAVVKIMLWRIFEWKKSQEGLGIK